VTILCRDIDIDTELVYVAAKVAAENEGYEAMLAYDEYDAAGKAMLGLFDWDSSSIVNIDGVEMEIIK